MKTIKFALLSIFTLALSGCISTELVDVDKKSALKSGIEITSFDDNPIFAYIKYDSSRIRDFDESKVKVSLVRSSAKYPPSSFDAYVIKHMNVEGNMEWSRLALASYANTLPNFCRDRKDVTILHREPGFIKILAIDDIGTYVVSYDN